MQAHAAQKHKELTEDLVRELIQTTSDITSGKTSGMSGDEVVKFMDKHVEEGARFSSMMKYIIPGQAPQEATMSLSKEEFLNGIAEGAKAVENYDNHVEILKVEIASNGKNATVETRSTENGVMPISAEGETQNVPIEGTSTCAQIIRLNKGVIQMFGAKCVTEIKFTPNSMQ